MNTTRKHRWTPLHIMLMLHYYAIAEPVKNSGAPAAESYTRELEKNNLIERDETWPSGWRSTEKGVAFVNMICDTPLPRAAWCDAQDRIVKIDAP